MKRKNRYLQILISLLTIGGVAAWVFIYTIPSMEKNSLLFGYSAYRIVLGGVMLVVLAGMGWLSIKAFTDAVWLERVSKGLESCLIEEEQLLPLVGNLTLLILLGAGIFTFYHSQWAYLMGMIVSVIERSFSVILWGYAAIFLILVYLLLQYTGLYRQRGKPFSIGKMARSLYLMTLVLITIFHWATLFFRLETLTVINGWFWDPVRKASQKSDILFLAVALISIGVVWYLLSIRRPNWRQVALLILLGYFLQISFGFIEGGGYESLRQKYIRTDHRRYAQYACSDPELVNVLQDYENQYGDDYYLGTKPPGIMAFYIITQNLSDMFYQTRNSGGDAAHLPSSETVSDDCYQRLTSFMSIAFPLLAVIILIVLFKLSKIYLDEDTWLYPGLLYIFMPSVLLMPIFLDQALYPLLFLFGIYWAARASDNQSPIRGFLLGVYLNLTLFLSFSLLPLVALSIIWIMVDYLSNRATRQLRPTIIVLISVITGFLAAYLTLAGIFNYDFIIRYQNALAQHREFMQFELTMHYLRDSIILNNVEFATWIGIPVFLIFLARAGRAVRAFIKREQRALDWLVAAFTAMYIGLNALGQTMGEVGRLWIFMMPMIAFFAASELKAIFKMKRFGLATMLALQLITVIMIYKFQDINGLFF